MINYYEELKFDKNWSCEDIMEELSKLEVLWRKREVTRPEVASEKLTYINQAKNVFASEASKAEYDRSLFSQGENSTTQPVADPNRQEFDRWYTEAKRFFDSKQFDLAKTALDNAMKYNYGDADDDFCRDASQIYRDNKDYSRAVDFINKAIVLNPEDGRNYSFKGLIYDRMYCDGRFAHDGNDYVKLSRDNINMALEKGRKTGYTELISAALDLMSFSLYNREPSDVALAEKYALEAKSLGGITTNADKVLSAINEERVEEAIRNKKLEEERIEAEKRRAIEQAEALKAAKKGKYPLLRKVGIVVAVLFGLEIVGVIFGFIASVFF